MDKLNEEFLKENLIDMVFALRYSYGTDVHMGCTRETSPEFEKLVISFMELSKMENVPAEDISKFNSNKEKLFSTIFGHRTQDDNYELNKINLEIELETLKFKREFKGKDGLNEENPLVENIVEKFDD